MTDLDIKEYDVITALQTGERGVMIALHAKQYNVMTDPDTKEYDVTTVL